jgi:hypothetical protein
MSWFSRTKYKMLSAWSQQPKQVKEEIVKTQSFKSLVRAKRYRTRVYGAEMSIAQWRMAVETALSPPYYMREPLLRILERTVDDADVFSAIDTRVKKVLAEKFYLINTKGEPDPGATKLLESSWMMAVIKAIIESEFYGTSVVELEKASMAQGRFTKCMLIPREYLSPERGMITPDPANPEWIIPYREMPFSNWLLEFGDPDDLGTLKKVAYYYIRKQFSEKDWSKHSERFGMPHLVVRTTTTDEKELDEMEQTAAEFGQNGYLILDDMDNVELLESRQNAPQEMYNTALKYWDSKIAKVLSGQESTTSPKAFVGAAEVHERILETYNDADLRRCTADINEKVIPFLISKGYPLQGYTFQYEYFYLMDKYKSAKQVRKQADKDEESETEALRLLSANVPFTKGCCH